MKTPADKKNELGKQQVAEYYEITVKTLMKWLKPIESQLLKAGYKKTNKVFTKKQFFIIVDFL